MANSHPGDNGMPEGIGPLEMCYADHTLLDIRLVSDIDENRGNLGCEHIKIQFDPNNLGRIYVSPNFDEPVYDSGLPSSTDGRAPLT
jgi:hypothetical protein